MKVAINGGAFALHTQIDGVEGAPWLILSNGLGTDLTVWEPQVAQWAARFRILRYDTRGHGLSEGPPGPYAPDDLVRDVVGLMDHYGIARATLMGLSLGGATCVGVALHEPKRVSALICCDARVDSPPPYVQAWAERIALVEKAGTTAIVNGSMERWVTAPTRAARPDLVQRLRAMLENTSDQGYMACAAALQHLAYFDRLHAITCPTLFVVGSLDTASPPEVMAAMAAQVAGAQLVQVPEAAHISNLENVAAFNATVDEFMVSLQSDESQVVSA
ncbi:alpha/beta fold hydrolase [Acidisoma cladoniae]|uniref:alpha/beta fold hydrolase n=1 Tax=Acidisoma cladoniae TaxID=3040935 RepID=UPI0025505DFB|nr:alpha/beta fold hydrolase [Acidisoma sp. PAMC 29798]